MVSGESAVRYTSSSAVDNKGKENDAVISVASSVKSGEKT